METILIVEDDKLLNKTLSYNLAADGYETTSAYTFTMALEAMKGKKFSLIVMDVNLPDGNGFDLCRKVKEKAAIPVIFLTANDMESDMIKGFELGADDYVTKPFPIHVFQRKIKALFKRMHTEKHKDCYDDGRLWIDFDGMNAKWEEAPLLFTPMEYKMLKLFIQNANIVLTRQEILEKLWDIDGNYVDEHTLTSVISRIRRKIEVNEAVYIKTVYGMGYLWAGEVG